MLVVACISIAPVNVRLEDNQENKDSSVRRSGLVRSSAANTMSSRTGEDRRLFVLQRNLLVSSPGQRLRILRIKTQSQTRSQYIQLDATATGASLYNPCKYVYCVVMFLP